MTIGAAAIGAVTIGAVAVVIPARDEEDAVEDCLSAVRESLSRLPAGTATAVTVVLDRCVDRTPQRVGALLADWPQATCLEVGAVGGHRGGRVGRGPTHIVAGSGVGALRDLGVREAVQRLRRPPEAIWVLSTDADTIVPPDWAGDHLELATAGAAGVAGLADLDGPVSADVARYHDAIVRFGLDGEHHDHVYGANLGVRADAYLAVGGFPVDGPGEDHALWSALVGAGYPVRQPTALRVRTSARTDGRAAGGLADLLRDLSRADGAP